MTSRPRRRSAGAIFILISVTSRAGASRRSRTRCSLPMPWSTLISCSYYGPGRNDRSAMNRDDRSRECNQDRSPTPREPMPCCSYYGPGRNDRSAMNRDDRSRKCNQDRSPTPREPMPKCSFKCCDEINPADAMIRSILPKCSFPCRVKSILPILWLDPSCRDVRFCAVMRSILPMLWYTISSVWNHAGQRITVIFACDPNVAVNAMVGLPFLRSTGRIMDFIKKWPCDQGRRTSFFYWVM